MAMSINAIAYGAVVVAGVTLFWTGRPSELSQQLASSPADAAGQANQAAPARPDDVKLHSVSVELPDSQRAFPGGATADVINNNCLACHSAGMVLNQPAYKTYHLELGEISSYPPGYKENAGIFCHNNPWVMIAETVIGRGDRAFELWMKIAPAYREEISEVHRLEPYVYAQMIAGKDAPRHGEAKNSWLTGTAAWNFVAISQHILGIKPELSGLRINPCIGAAIPSFTLTRKCRGATYQITVDNKATGRVRMTIDGAAHDSTLVPYAAAGKTVVIECET